MKRSKLLYLQDKNRMIILDPYKSAISVAFQYSINTALGDGLNQYDLQSALPDGQTYDFTVNWGDGNSYSYSGTTPSTDSNLIHPYSSGGIYQISISGKCGGYSNNNTGDKDKITSVDQWGDVGFDYLEYAFDGCSNLTSIESEFADMSNITSLVGFIQRCPLLTNINVSNWDVSNCTDISNFANQALILPALNVANWNVANVTNIGGFIATCREITVIEVSSWNVSNVTYSGYFAFGAIKLTTCNTNSWNTSSITNCTFMFDGCVELTSSFDANLWWDRLIPIATFSNCFRNCTKISNYASIPFDWKGMVEVGTLTTDQTTLQQVGITRTYTGIAEIHWGDGGFTRTSSGVEALHDYGATGTYDIKLGVVSTSAFTGLTCDTCSLVSINLQSDKLGTLNFSSNNLTSLDLSNCPVEGQFLGHTNPSLSSIIFASTGNSVFTDFRVYNCALTSLDLSNNPVSGIVNISGNPSLTSVTFASSGNAQVYSLSMNQCNFSTIDLSNVPIRGVINFRLNPSLSSILFASTGNGAITTFRAYGCSISNIDFSIFSSSNSCTIEIYDNAMTAAEVNLQLVNLDGTGWINGTLNIAGTNAAADSTSGGVDGLAAIASLQAKGWTITYN
jgi:surface protein